jgi:hypothetical protein
MKAQLTQREKVLSLGVGTVALLFVNFFVVDLFLKNKKALDAGISRQTAQLKVTRSRFPEKAEWQQREAWLNEHQPKLVNESSAGVQLLDQVRKLAATHSVSLEDSPVIKVPARRPEYIAASVDVEVTSPWKALVGFVSEMQKPDQFVVLEKANFKIDSKDQTQMRGKFTIAKWYAPK